MDTINTALLNRLEKFRREIHRHPELSHHESETSGKVNEWLVQTRPDRMVTSLGGHGIAAIYDSGRPGPSVLFRCELDALPIKETGLIPHKSVNDGIGHLCGHDGHMAIMLGLASFIQDNKPVRGRAILLFQPAEETGTGAALVISDPKFHDIRPDFSFAIHNLPGFPIHGLVIADPVFSAGSIGMEIELSGKTSHAAEPENGINPALAISRIIRSFDDITHRSGLFDEFVLITIIQVLLGEKAYGTSAGHAILRATLRAINEKDYNKLIKHARSEAEHIGKQERLGVKITTMEEFPVTSNHPECTKLITALAQSNDWPVTWLDTPFRWSEDFGHFCQISRGALIGLGSGLEQPNLHHPDYDFPDALTPTGINVFSSIYSKFLTK